MRFIIRDLTNDEETWRRIYQTLVDCAHSRATHFELRIERQMYATADEIQELLNCGQVQSPDSATGVIVRGQPTEQLCALLKQRLPPAKAIAGDLAPCDRITYYRNDRVLYIVYEYGREQVLDLQPAEVIDLRDLLQSSGLDPRCLEVAPDYIQNADL